MSLFDIVEEKYEAPVRGSKRSISSASPLKGLKELKEPRPTTEEPKKAAGDDWDEIKDDSTQIQALSELLIIERMRLKGIAPDHYTSTTTCKHCGPVPIFEGCPPEVQDCPWCFNRIKGQPIPETT